MHSAFPPAPHILRTASRQSKDAKTCPTAPAPPSAPSARDAPHSSSRFRPRNPDTGFRPHPQSWRLPPSPRISMSPATVRAEWPLHAAPAAPATSAPESQFESESSSLPCSFFNFNQLQSARISNSSVPANGRFIQVDIHLLGLQILLKPPRSQLPAEARLLVPAPRRFHVRGLHVIHPDNSRTQ